MRPCASFEQISLIHVRSYIEATAQNLHGSLRPQNHCPESLHLIARVRIEESGAVCGPSIVKVGSVGDQTCVLTAEGEYDPAEVFKGKLATV